MEQWLDVRTLIWLFPIIFMLHDLEEIIMIEKWIHRNSGLIRNKLPKKFADKVIKQFSMSTAQFSVAVVVIFIFVSSSTYLASQHMNQGPFGNIYFFTVMVSVFFLHVFTHIGQSIALKSITPGVITSVLVVLPYCLILFNSLFKYKIITWSTLYIGIPFVLFIFPVVFFAHWIGKKAI